jgi:hypothetical protein
MYIPGRSVTFVCISYVTVLLARSRLAVRGGPIATALALSSSKQRSTHWVLSCRGGNKYKHESHVLYVIRTKRTVLTGERAFGLPCKKQAVHIVLP